MHSFQAVRKLWLLSFFFEITQKMTILLRKAKLAVGFSKNYRPFLLKIFKYNKYAGFGVCSSNLISLFFHII